MNNNFKLLILFFSFLFLVIRSFGVDTLRVMHYNLLYYDKNTTFCTSSNNNVDLKDGYLREIVGHYKPDIFTANEINGSTISVQRILNNVFNINGVDYFKRGNYQGDYLVNMVYYNSQKLVLKSQSYVLTSPRITDVYRFYIKTDNLISGDTIFLTCFVSHLKAGSTSSDAIERAEAVQQIMSYINNRNIQGNVMVMGDFNLYTSSESAFQKFITPTATGFRFFDPVDAMGNWQGNSTYAEYHTQSTHTSGTCFSGGGMDDRFDFILTSLNILQPGELTYVEESYWAYGQDGKHFNQSLTSSTNVNNSLPSNVIEALYSMSDHLPVTLKLAYNQQSTSISTSDQINNGIYIRGNNTNYVDVFYSGITTQRATISLINIIGAAVYKQDVVLVPGFESRISIDKLNPGVYLIVVKGNNIKKAIKFVKQ